VCSRAAGQTDAVVEGETGVYVKPGDVQAMRRAIRELLAAPERSEAMGRNGRAHVETTADVVTYASQIAATLERLADGAASAPDSG
jgi:glycosyltransferase involved in cell wall biosynthesis